jgi:hypothetical protein
MMYRHGLLVRIDMSKSAMQNDKIGHQSVHRWSTGAGGH